MSDVIFSAFLIAILVLIVGLIKPKLVLLGTKKKSRAWVLYEFVLFSSFLFFMIVVDVTINPTIKNTDQAAEVVREASSSKQAKPSGMARYEDFLLKQ